MMDNYKSFVYSLLFLTCIGAGAAYSTQKINKIGIKALTPRHTAADCDITPLIQSSSGNTTRCNKFVERYVDGSFAQNLTICQVTKNETVLQYQCVEGSWKLSTGTDFHLRSRRFAWGAFFGFLSAAITLVTVIYCSEKYGNVECKETDVEPKDLVAPKYTTCPPPDIQSVYTAGRKQKTVQVTWTDPIATDDEELLSNEQTCCGYQKGNAFPGLPDAGYPHTVTYTAKDNYGLSATCNFNFVVKYLTCNEPAIPVNGRKVSCPDGYIYGGECTFECYSGYEMVGSDTATCQQDQTWDNIPACQKVVCEAPFEIANGNVECDDPSYPFDDDCSFTCDAGFKRNGPLKMTCQADQTWSVDASQVSCVDDDSPVIECKSPQVFFAGRGSFSTSVTWEVPAVSDNVDPNPSVVQQSGPSQGQTLSEGFHSVEYKATDGDGNSNPQLSECTIVLEVKVIKCSTGPTDALDEPRFMMYNCSDTSFYNGVSCYLDCDLNLPLNGTDLMTCERDGTTDKGVWNWGSGHQPVCEVIECPALDPPPNGAYTNDSVNARPLHVMLCQKGYDISSVGSEFQGRLSCQDSGKWYPLNAFPDCIVSILSWLNLPADLYYEGNCNDEATKDEIKQNVLVYLAKVQADVDKSICPDVDTCKVENVGVVCGDTSGRKRRSSGRHIIHKRNSEYALVDFEIKVLFDQKNKTTQDAYIEFLATLNAISDRIQVDVNNGELDQPGFTLATDAFQTGQSPHLLCDSGYKVDTGSVSCKPCPPGTYLDSGTGLCEYCHIGEYMDHEGALECDACPESHSTLSTGSKDISKCIKLCSPGYYSSSTMEPCSACGVGNYQPGEGQTGCLSCPFATATNTTGSISADSCDNFDISVDILQKRTDIGSFSADEKTVVSVSVWLKLRSNENSDMSLYIADSVGDIITLSSSDSLSVQAGSSDAILTSNALSWNNWTHVISTVDMASGTLKLYVDGSLVVDESIAITPYRTVSAGNVHILSSSKGMYVSGLILYGRHLSDDDMTSLSQTCAVTSNDEIFSMTNILPKLTEGITVITPTTCDPVDECATKPCGDHTCINMVNDFQCICHGGMTGDLCNIAPDYCLDNECVNGDCVPGNGTYTCSCNDGYSGVFCDTPPVNGGWSQWVEWSGCDVTCGGGTRSRNRTCNNPPPGFMGNDCEGDDMEYEVCNEQTCPTCSPLSRKIGTVVNCVDNESDNLQECNMTCINGKVLPNGQKSFEYTCGESTNYTWQPIDKTPECVDVERPEIFGAQVNVPYITPISSSDQSNFITAVEQQFSDVGCVENELCEMTSTVSNLSRKRRSTSSTLTMQFSITLSDTGNLALGDYLSYGTESSAMTELLEALNAINVVIEFIQNNTASIFQVTVDGVDYTLASDTASIVATVTCPSGYAGADGLCAQCAAGTRLEDSMCIDCEPGTYQPLTGQSTCLSCPSGYTTPTYGASDISECSVETADSDSGNGSNNDDDDDDDDDGDDDDDDDDDDGDNTEDSGKTNTVLIAVAVVSSFAFILSVVAIGVLLWKKFVRRRFRRNETTGSFASLSMVRSASSCSGVIENGRTTLNVDNIKGSVPAKPLPHHNPVFQGPFHDKPPSYDSHGFS